MESTKSLTLKDIDALVSLQNKTPVPTSMLQGKSLAEFRAAHKAVTISTGMTVGLSQASHSQDCFDCALITVECHGRYHCAGAQRNYVEVPKE